MDKFIKINEDNIIKLYEEGHKEMLVDKVYWQMVGISSDCEMELDDSLVDCESPIEQLLSIELTNLGLKRIVDFNPFIDVLDIEKQKEIKIKSKKYRVDFCIPVVYKNQENKCYVIECDGYEFHQKTKKQVEEDNKRQRDLQKEGYEIIRFSGSEIFHKPKQCALEVKNIILAGCKYINERN